MNLETLLAHHKNGTDDCAYCGTPWPCPVRRALSDTLEAAEVWDDYWRRQGGIHGPEAGALHRAIDRLREVAK